MYDYLNSLGKSSSINLDFKKNYKWLNLHLDFSSYIEYNKEGELSFFQWLKKLKGKKIISYFDILDPLPMFVHLYRILVKGIVKFIR